MILYVLIMILLSPDHGIIGEEIGFYCLPIYQPAPYIKYRLFGDGCKRTDYELVIDLNMLTIDDTPVAYKSTGYLRARSRLSVLLCHKSFRGNKSE